MKQGEAVATMLPPPRSIPYGPKRGVLPKAIPQPLVLYKQKRESKVKKNELLQNSTRKPAELSFPLSSIAYLLNTIFHLSIYISYLSLSYLLFYLSYIHLSLIHPSPIRHRDGRQNTVMRRHCAPEGEAQPPHDGILPACH
jgi:hypothetical protein